MKEVLKDGVWRPGSAGPEHLEKELAQMPGELVTKEVADETKIHKLDPPHIRTALVKEYGDKLFTPPPKTFQDVMDLLGRTPAGVRVPIRQDFVDVERFIVIVGEINKQVELMNLGAINNFDFELKHIWFLANNVNNYVVRPGRPPRPSKRPSYLRNVSLIIDIFSLPRSIRDRFRSIDHSSFIDKYEKLVEMFKERAQDVANNAN